MTTILSGDLNGHKIYVQSVILHSHLVGPCWVCIQDLVYEEGYTLFFVVFSAPCKLYCYVMFSPNVYFTFMTPKLIPLGSKNMSLVSYSANVQADYDPPSY